MRSRTPLTITSNMTRASGAPIQRCGPSPNATWVGRPGQQHVTRALELLLVVVGRDPADEHPVVASKLLARKDRVPADGAAELFVDREVAQKFIRRGAVQRGTLDELPSQIWMGAEVQKAERRQRRRRVDAAADEVPENVDELFVVESPAVELELDEET